MFNFVKIGGWTATPEMSVSEYDCAYLIRRAFSNHMQVAENQAAAAAKPSEAVKALGPHCSSKSQHRGDASNICNTVSS